jgi:hypothetical protein
VDNKCVMNRPFRRDECLMLTTTDTFPQTFRRYTCSQPVLQEHHAHSALFRASAPLSPSLQGQEGMQNLTRLECRCLLLIDKARARPSPSGTHTTHTRANLSRLQANVSWLIRK